MISLELSTIQAKDAERNWLAQAMADFEIKSGPLTTIPLAVRDLDLDTEFNGRTKSGKTAPANPTLESKVASTAESMTIAEASRAFHLSQADLEKIAERMGFKFRRGYTTNQAYRDGDEILVERIKALQAVGLNRAQVRRQVGISYHKFHRLLKEYSIDFPAASGGHYSKAASHA
jgi:DNA-binding NtrC family response regulator